MRLRQTIFWGLVMACASLGACDITTAPGESELAQARQRWTLSNIRSYSYTASRSCFCAPASLRSITVTVTNGVVTGRVYAGTGEPVAAADSEFSTVEAWFGVVQAALARHADVVDVKYDAALGVPVSISIDGSFQAADDEVTYSVSGFTPR